MPLPKHCFLARLHAYNKILDTSCSERNDRSFSNILYNLLAMLGWCIWQWDTKVKMASLSNHNYTPRSCSWLHNVRYFPEEWNKLEICLLRSVFYSTSKLLRHSLLPIRILWYQAPIRKAKRNERIDKIAEFTLGVVKSKKIKW